MLHTYFKIAIRSLLRNRLFSFINIFGLALSMSVCMMVMLRARDQLSYDRFHPHASSTYRVITRVNNAKHDQFYLASTPLPLKNAIVQNANISNAVLVYPALHNDATFRDRTIKIQGAFTEPSYFQVFGFHLREGSEQTALTKPNSIILSKETAEKLFAKENPLGQMVSLDKLGVFLVTGVLQTPPGKSHLNYDALVSVSSLAALERSGQMPVQSSVWNPFQQAYTYFSLTKATGINAVQQQLNDISRSLNKEAKENTFSFELQPLTQITPGRIGLYNDNSNGSGWAKIITEMTIGLLILLAGCFNYTNLTIARALTRAKEVGIRKVAGARRSQIFIQYIVESICMALLSMGLAYIILSFILEYKPFNDGYEFMPEVKLDAAVFLLFFVFTLLTGVLAGSLPAWILSSFRPVEVLKNIRTRKLFGNISLQKSLVVFQFSLSLIALIFLSSFYLQFAYLAKVETGFRSDHIITISLEGADPHLLAQEFGRINGVESTSAVSGNFGKSSTGSAMISGNDSVRVPVQMNYFFADEGTVPVSNLKLVAGTNFSPTQPGITENAVLINEQAVKALGFKNNASCIGEMLRINDTLQVEIKGVIKDFYYQGAGNNIRPLLLRNRDKAFSYLNVLVNTSDAKRIENDLRSTFRRIYPNKTFNYYWLDKQIKNMNNQTATISLLGFLGMVTLTIGSLGLLGLVVYTVETRRKEISIRKVIGARVQQLVFLLSDGFIRLLLISGCIAIPLGFTLSKMFLQNFANRIHFGIIHTVACFFFLLTIGLITIISQTWRAASSNPAPNLRME